MIAKILEAEGLNRDDYLYHHGAWCRGYVYRTPCYYNGIYGYCRAYNGRFGRGIVCHLPSWASTQYHRIVYLIAK